MTDYKHLSSHPDCGSPHWYRFERRLPPGVTLETNVRSPDLYVYAACLLLGIAAAVIVAFEYL